MKRFAVLVTVLYFGQLIAFAAGVTYSYDAAGRLARIDYGSQGSITYTYDNAGNLLSRTVLASGSATQKSKDAKPAKKPAAGEKETTKKTVKAES